MANESFNPYSSPSSDVASDNNSNLPIKSYKALRMVNLFFAILSFPSFFLWFISMKEYSASTLGPLIILGIYFGNFLATAIVINPSITVFFNIPIIIIGAYKKIANILLLVTNSILSLIGVFMVIACIVSSQYPLTIFGIILLFLGISNLRALWATKNA